jgi:hypothetical protein
MTNSTITSQNRREQDQGIWLSLRQAISKSSGFQRWQQEKNVSVNVNGDLDVQVRHYLTETLETLAY